MRFLDKVLSLSTSNHTIPCNLDAARVFDSRATADLKEEAQYLTNWREELQHHRLRLLELGDKPSIEYVEMRLSDVLEELQRRKRLIAKYNRDPLAPVWPSDNGKLGELARELKQLWPLHRFCREMLLLNVTSSGDRYVACCPIHAERTPSFTIYPDDRYKCFGCGEHGDIYDLIGTLYSKATFTERVKMLAGVVS